MVELKNAFPEGSSMRRVIDYATKEFFTLGVKQVTMDSIAKGLQMSKRTLYQLFADKEQLIIACIEVMTEEEQKMAQSLCESKHNVLEVILRLIENRMKAFEQVSPQYIVDISRYPAVQEYIQASKTKRILHVEQVFKTGLQQGLFRQDININLITNYLFVKETRFTDQNTVMQYTIPELFIHLGIFHLRGCCTPRGIELIDKFLEHYRKEQEEKTK